MVTMCDAVSNRDLGFTDVDRVENIRRVAEVARLFVEAGLIVIVSLISPFRLERKMARECVRAGEFVEIFVDTPIELCRQRDPKGLHAKAARKELVNFTGVDLLTKRQTRRICISLPSITTRPRWPTT